MMRSGMSGTLAASMRESALAICRSGGTSRNIPFGSSRATARRVKLSAAIQPFSISYTISIKVIDDRPIWSPLAAAVSRNALAVGERRGVA